MNSILGLRGRRAAVAVVGIFAIAGGVAYAAIPDAAGVIHACYRTSTDDQQGQLRVVADPASCRSNELPTEWNVTGPAGPVGADGQDGQDGVSPTVTQLAAGDADCPTGGAAITDAAGTTAHVCNGLDGQDGTPFSGTFTSPNGLYSISVTDTGVTVASPDSSIKVTGTQIRIETTGTDEIFVRSAGNLDLLSGLGLELRGANGIEMLSGSGLLLRGGGAATLEGLGSLALKGPVVSVNSGATCPPAARLGDSVNTATNTIATGSSTVCIG